MLLQILQKDRIFNLLPCHPFDFNQRKFYKYSSSLFLFSSETPPCKKVQVFNRNPVSGFISSFNMEDLKKLTVNFSLFATSSNFSPASKSPRSFVNDGTVGLGIVAAMQDSEALQKSTTSAAAAISSVNFPKINSNSKAIPIISSASAAAKSESQRELMELSESYTCVISHIGDEAVKKQEYYNDDQITVTTGNVFRGAEKSGRGVFSVCSPYLGEVQQGVGSFWSSDFLSSCSLCCKKLQGIDIFMYRGEKAFCSAECREKHIASDDHKEKCRKGAMRSIDQSPSSCSCQTTTYFAGVAAA